MNGNCDHDRLHNVKIYEKHLHYFSLYIFKINTFEKKKHENVNGTHHEDNENEKDLMYEELKELTLGHESPYLSMSCDVNDTPDENICTMENDFLNVTANSEKKEESSSPPVEHPNFKH